MKAYLGVKEKGGDAGKYQGLVDTITNDPEILGRLSETDKYCLGKFRLYMKMSRSRKDYELFHRSIAYASGVAGIESFVDSVASLSAH